MAIDSIKDKAKKAFSSIDTQRALLSSCTSQWLELERHFSDLEQAIQQKFLDLAEREKVFKTKMEEANASLDRREESISARELSSSARVQEQKEAAIAAINEEKKKLQNEQSKKDQSKSPGSKKHGSEVKVAGPPSVPTLEASVAATSGTNGGSKDAANLLEAVSQTKVASIRPLLKSFCEKMDGEGLRKFIVDRKKAVDAFRNELPSALRNAADPSALVLKALQGYHTLDLDPSQAKETGASANRRACILLLECLAVVLADPVLGVDHPIVPSTVKESARVIAQNWRSRITDDNALDSLAFLQLLATFGIASAFDSDDLCKLVFTIARRQQTPPLCRSLGLISKMPGMVDKLAKDGKQLEALSFANAFQLMNRLQPVALLQSYLKEARNAAQKLEKSASNKAAGQNDATMKELSALKSVIKAVEDYKLASQYPTDDLVKRAAQLEKEKSERKKALAEKKKVPIERSKTNLPPKQDSKKPRLSGGGPGSGASGGIGTSNIGIMGGAGYDSSTFFKGPPSTSGYYAPTDRGKYSGSLLPSFGLTNQVGYERRPEAGFGSSLAGSYNYSATDTIGSSLLGSASAYSDLPGAFSSYKFSSGLTPPSSSYLSPYLR